MTIELTQEHCQKNEHKFWKRVHIDSQEGCWIWKGTLTAGYTNRKTYPNLRYGLYGGKGHRYRSHRFAYVLANGEIPVGMCVLHKCDNPKCVNPAHLRLGTRIENAEDMRKKRRAAHGTNHWQAKITPETVRAIRAEYGAGIRHKDIAKKYGIFISNISAIGLRRTWRHVT